MIEHIDFFFILSVVINYNLVYYKVNIFDVYCSTLNY